MLPLEQVMNKNEHIETPGCFQNTALARALEPTLILCCSYLSFPQIKQRFRRECSITQAACFSKISALLLSFSSPRGDLSYAVKSLHVNLAAQMGPLKDLSTGC